MGHCQSPVTIPDTIRAMSRLSPITHHPAIPAYSPWASPPEVSTAMARPTPIFVGSVGFGWAMVPELKPAVGKRPRMRENSPPVCCTVRGGREPLCFKSSCLLCKVRKSTVELSSWMTSEARAQMCVYAHTDTNPHSECLIFEVQQNFFQIMFSINKILYVKIYVCLFGCFLIAQQIRLNHQLLLHCVYHALPLFLNFLVICIYAFQDVFEK